MSLLSRLTSPKPHAPISINFEDINLIEKDGEFWMTSEELGRQLGFELPASSIAKIYERNAAELRDYCTNVNLTCVDGKQRETRCFSEEGVYVVTMLAKTERAKTFRSHVAKLLRQLREKRFAEKDMQIASLQGDIELLKVQHREDKEAAVRLALTIHPSRRKHILPAVRYRRMGLKNREIGKLLDEHNRTIGSVLSTARKLGLLEPATPRTPVIRKPTPSPKTSRPSGKAA